jgi:tetratricopeptide (TPR) repeat protein
MCEGAGSPASASLRARAQEAGYNLDYADAFRFYREAIAADPDDPVSYRMLASLTWLDLLYRRGAVMVDDYLGDARPNLARRGAPAAIEIEFQQNAQRSLELAERLLRRNPDSAEAHFLVGASVALLASYSASVDGRLIAGFRTSHRAYTEHLRVLEIDPARKDAALTVGTYQYAVSTFSFPMRLLARIAGFDSARDHGIHLIEESSRYPSDFQTDAKLALVVIYNRERRFEDASREIADLQRRFPRNRILWLEAGSTALRAGRAEEALRAIETGIASYSSDQRPKAFGEEARWRYYHAAALRTLGRRNAAGEELRAALALPSPRWLQGRVHLELGRLSDAAGDRTTAVSNYRSAIAHCAADSDSACSDEARELIGHPFKSPLARTPTLGPPASAR